MPTATQTHLRRRYTKLMAMQAIDPARFDPSPRGAKWQIRDERYNQALRYLRMRMPETWDPRTAHLVSIEERVASLAEHVWRTKCLAAAIANHFPMTGDERLLWSKLDEAYHWVQAALEIVRGGDEPDAAGADQEEIDEAEIVASV
jgi:hypothetical protein